MKTITITYDVWMMKNETKVNGETCIDITVTENIADRLLNNKIGSMSSVIATKMIEKAFEALESLKGRTYIKGSIKDIRES